MKGLVWALYLMVLDPSAAADGQPGASQGWAYTGVTYLHRASCESDAKTFTGMGTAEKAGGIDDSAQVAYICVLQPKPGHYKG